MYFYHVLFVAIIYHGIVSKKSKIIVSLLFIDFIEDLTPEHTKFTGLTKKAQNQTGPSSAMNWIIILIRPMSYMYGALVFSMIR
jgi:hypothetical protein